MSHVPKIVSLSLPFGIGSVQWEVARTQSRAAWSLYVELVTRIAVESLKAFEGVVCEALNSFALAEIADVEELLEEPDGW